MSVGRPPAVGDPFPVGVNYWPRRKAMGWWKAFDRAEVEDEFDVIAGLGLSVVRIFLLWEDFQPTPGSGLADRARRPRDRRRRSPRTATWAST